MVRMNENDDFIEDVVMETIGKTKKSGHPVEGRAVQCTMVYPELVSSENVVYGRFGDFRTLPGDNPSAAELDEYRDYYGKYQQYYRAYCFELDGTPTTIDIPIRCAYFLDHHECLNCDDGPSTVSVRPLCSNEYCVLKDHMVLESMAMWTSRKYCSAKKTECQHDPPCIIAGSRYWLEHTVDIDSDDGRVTLA